MDEAPSVARRVSDAWSALLGSHRLASRDLIASLNVAADAVSSASDVAQVLGAIVDAAKEITDTDKAVLALTDDSDEHLDLETVVVRGNREVHDQEWWSARLEYLGEHLWLPGQPMVDPHPEHGATLLVSPVTAGDRLIGLLAAINSIDRPFTAEQRDFLGVLAAFASSAIENARLAEQSRYVLLASERERIAREMHDGPVQSLFSISLGLEVCKKQVFRDPQAVHDRLDELQTNLNTSMAELRRFIYDLRSMKLSEMGLVGALEYWVREVTDGTAVRGRVRVDGELPIMTPAEEACLYRVGKEAVSNAVRHANARTVSVVLGSNDGHVTVEVQDDGDGFDVRAAMGDRTAPGIGLRSISERVSGEGGAVRFDSGPGQGTRVEATLPVRGARG